MRDSKVSGFRLVVWRYYLVFGLGLAVAYFTVPAEQAELIVWPAIGWSSVFAMLVGVRLHRPDTKWAWYLLAGGVATLIVGDHLYIVETYILHNEVPFPSYIDVVYLAMYPLLISGLILLIRRRTPGRDVASLLDACIITVGVGLISWLLLIVPYFRTHDISALARLAAIQDPLGDIAMFAVTARLALGSGRRPAAFYLVAVSMFALFVADALYGFMNLADTWKDSRAISAGWIVFYVGWGLAALHPSMRQLSVRFTGAVASVSARRVALVICTAMVPLAVLFFQLRSGRVSDGDAIVVTGIVLFALVLLRTTGLTRELADTRQEARFCALFENTSDAVLILDDEGRVKYLTPSIERVLGLEANTLLDRLIGDFLAADDERELHVLLATSGGTTKSEWKVRSADGSLRDVEVVTSDLRGDSRVNGLVLTMRDIGERKVLDAELRRHALYDSLTNLPNRSLFDDRVSRALSRADRARTEIAVLFLDLDDFKVVNDSLGHSAGDELLRAVALRLLSVVKLRETVARFGGDQFVVLIEELSHGATPEFVAQRLHEALKDPFRIGTDEIRLRASIGIAVGRARECTPAQLMRDADLAMYVAKCNGSGRAERFAPEMHESAVRRLEVASELPAAILDGQLVLFYQPILDISSGRIVGCEALVRWNHPNRGLILPNEFIPIAESTGVVLLLGAWALVEACRQTSEWRDAGLVDDTFYTSVNLSARHFRDRRVIDDVVHALDVSQLPAGALVLEVTESAFVQDVEMVGFRELRELGVRLAIDDFGTGYSSLSRVIDLPVDFVKIDKLFVDRLIGSADGETMVRAVVALSHSLGIKVVAEGVEERAQAYALTRLGCALAQGYLFARPMPFESMRGTLAAQGIEPYVLVTTPA